MNFWLLHNYYQIFTSKNKIDFAKGVSLQKFPIETGARKTNQFFK